MTSTEARRQGIAVRLLSEVLRFTGRAAPGEPICSVINAQNLASIDLHKGIGFAEVERAATLAGIEFTGGEGVLVRCSSEPACFGAATRSSPLQHPAPCPHA